MQRDWSVQFGVQAWEAWAPGLETKEAWAAWARGEAALGGEGAPAVAAMPALLRRRAGSLDRLALEVAYRLAPKGEDVSSVFASRHGEVARSVEMLRVMAKGEAPLPMTFSLSVHNAASGLYSIAREDRSASNSLAAHRASLPAAVLEACGQLKEGRGRVLVVCFDEHLPEPYQSFEDEHPTGWSLGMMLVQDGGARMELSCGPAPQGAAPTPGQPQALMVARMLASGAAQADVVDGGRLWAWRRL